MRIFAVFFLLIIVCISFIPIAYADEITVLQGKIAAMQRDLKMLREAIKNSGLPQEEKEMFYKSLNTLDKHTLERAKGNYNALITLKNAHDLDLFNRSFTQTELYYKKLIAERDRLEEVSDVARAAGQKPPTRFIEQNHEELERVEGKYRAFQKIKRDGARSINPLIKEALDYEEGFKTEILRFRGSFRLMLERLKPSIPITTIPGEGVPDPHYPPLKKQNKFGNSGSIQDLNKKNLFPVGSDGFFPDEDVITRRLKPVSVAPVIPASPPSFFSKALGVGVKGLKVLPLVGELWTRKENALLTSAHALTEACIRKESSAGETALYVGTQYIYRGLGFLSLIPNLGDSSTPESMQGTLDFLLNAGCFEEYRELIAANKDVFADVGLGGLSIVSSIDLTAREKQYENLQKRLNTPLTDEEIAVNKKADADARRKNLAEKKSAYLTQCLLAGNQPAVSSVDAFKNPFISLSSAVDGVIKNNTDMRSLTCDQLRDDINYLESQLIVRL